MKIKIINNIELEENIKSIKCLFEKCKWDWLSLDTEMITAFNNSFRCYVVCIDQEIIGFGRVISDQKIYGLLVDVMIDPAFRNKGYASALVEFITNDAKNNNLKIIQLLSSNEGYKLYQKSGFQTCPVSSPGMIKFL